MVSLVMNTSQFPVMGSEVLLSSGFSKETQTPRREYLSKSLFPVSREVHWNTCICRRLRALPFMLELLRHPSGWGGSGGLLGQNDRALTVLFDR